MNCLCLPENICISFLELFYMYMVGGHTHHGIHVEVRGPMGSRDEAYAGSSASCWAVSPTLSFPSFSLSTGLWLDRLYFTASTHCFLTSEVSDENDADHLIGNSLVCDESLLVLCKTLWLWQASVRAPPFLMLVPYSKSWIFTFMTFK